MPIYQLFSFVEAFVTRKMRNNKTFAYEKEKMKFLCFSSGFSTFLALPFLNMTWILKVSQISQFIYLQALRNDL